MVPVYGKWAHLVLGMRYGLLDINGSVVQCVFTSLYDLEDRLLFIEMNKCKPSEREGWDGRSMGRTKLIVSSCDLHSGHVTL